MKNILPFVLFESRINTTNFKHIKHLGGSTGADLYKDIKTNELWVVKHGAHLKHVFNEYMANKIYEKWGIKVPKAFIGEIDGEKALITQYLVNSVPLGEAKGISNEITRGFIFDVILANWDVVGTNYDLDNIRVTPDGQVWRVDIGGSLLYRALGAEKGKAFSETPTEQDTFRSISSSASKVFKDIKDKDIKERIKEEAKKYVVNDKISYIKFLRELKETIFNEDNELSNEEKQKTYKILAKRVFNLYKLFNI